MHGPIVRAIFPPCQKEIAPSAAHRSLPNESNAHCLTLSVHPKIREHYVKQTYQPCR